MIYRLLCFLLVAVLALPSAGAVADPKQLLENMRFQRFLTAEGEGESNGVGAILDIAQDETGYIWIAGEGGLAKFNSHDFTFYYADPMDPKALPSNWVSALEVDQDGTLWLATANGLSRYNRDTDDFTTLRASKADNDSLSYNLVHALTVDVNNRLIIGTGSGLSILDSERQHFFNFHHRPDDHNSLRASPVVALWLDRSQMLWIGYAGGGLSRLNLQSSQFNHWRHDPHNDRSLVENSVQTIAEDADGNIWIGTDSGGLSRFRRDGSGFDNYRRQRGDPHSIGSNVIRDIHLDGRGRLWIATDHGGLALYDPEIDGFHHKLHHTYDRTSLTSNQLREVFEDRQGNLWIGTVPTGINYYDVGKSRFRTLVHEPDDLNSLGHGGVLCITADSDGLIWIGTESGLNSYDRSTGQFTRYDPDPDDPTKLRFGAVTSVVEDVDGKLWVASWSGGLHLFDKSTQTFRNYFPEADRPESLIGPHIWQVVRDQQDTIWIAATQEGGISRYVRESDSFVHYKHDPANLDSLIYDFVWTLEPDDQGYLWIGTLHGLDRFDPRTEKFTHYTSRPGDPTSLSSDNVLALTFDSRNRLWLATEGGGVNLYDRETNRFRTFSVAQGLPSTHVASIIEDKNGDIWAGTSNGLARIDGDTFDVKVLRRSDGLAGNGHYRNASFLDNNGDLYIGSTSGITVFSPNKLEDVNSPPTVVITGFRIHNAAVPVGEPGSPLKQAIDQTRTLELSYRDSMFAFDFAALHFRSARQTTYSYRLEGFDPGWNDVGALRTATYTNLDPGDYTFRVRAKTGDGVWSEQDANIAITIRPPPWRTWYAYMGYLAVGLLALLLRTRYRALKRRSDIYQVMSTTDALTGVLNRHGLMQSTESLWGWRAPDHQVCVMVFDIDHFKHVNDIRGHDVGDRILRHVAQLVRTNIRDHDTFARWGGEEFVLVCEHINEQSALALAEKLRLAVADYIFEQECSPLHLTVSIGVASHTPGESFEVLFKRADDALYRAKNAGRNLVVLAVPLT